MATCILPESAPSRKQHRTEAMTTVDVKLGQLSALLSCCYGMGQDWLEEMGPDKRDHIMWLASDLARDAEAALRLFREVDHA